MTTNATRAPQGADIVAEARAWLGTPWHHQASAKGVGCDCKGLVFGVGVALGLVPSGHPVVARADYGRIDPRELIDGLRAVLDRVDLRAPGDVLLLIVGGKAQHLAIVGDGDTMIHTYGRGPGRVIEVPIGKSRAIHSVWRFRGIDHVG